MLLRTVLQGLLEQSSRSFEFSQNYLEYKGENVSLRDQFLQAGGTLTPTLDTFLSPSNVQWLQDETLRRVQTQQGLILADPGELIIPTEMPSFMNYLRVTLFVIARQASPLPLEDLNETVLRRLVPRYAERIVAKRLYRRRMVPPTHHVLPRPMDDRQSKNRDFITRRERNLHRILPKTHEEVRQLMRFRN